MWGCGTGRRAGDVIQFLGCVSDDFFFFFVVWADGSLVGNSLRKVLTCFCLVLIDKVLTKAHLQDTRSAAWTKPKRHSAPRCVAGAKRTLRKVIKAKVTRSSVGAYARRSLTHRTQAHAPAFSELNKVYTNGTLVDEELLTDEQAGHCVSIREYRDGDASSFGVCVLDSATSEVGLAAFADDVCRTRLETLVRQVRVKEVVVTKVRAEHVAFLFL
jgi:hypothetical protein